MKLARALLLIAAATAACSKADPSGGAKAPNPRDAVLDVFRNGGLAPSAFAPATLPIGGDCATGSVSGVDVAVCTFPTAEAAKAAEAAGLAWVGDTTGMAQSRGVLLVAAADRKKADPHGKAIDKMMKLLKT